MSDRQQSGAPRASLQRLFEPANVAIVGARDAGSNAWRGTLESDVEVFLVNPTVDEVLGRPTVPGLDEIGKPVDAILSLLGTERSVEVAEAAARNGGGGLVVIAGGYGETGGEGRALEDRLKSAAATGGFPVVGPNCAGFVHVGRHLDMTFLADFVKRPGGVSAVVHSGGVLEAIAAAGNRAGGVGLNLLVSSGNETVTDMADYLDYLVDDEGTRVILLAIEAIRRPEAFFAAARRAHAAGKPVLAVKIGRSARTLQMATSHTGVLTGDSWVYDVALRQANIILAGDVNELVDRAQLFDQVPPQRWTPVHGVAVLSGSGGMTALGYDLALEEGLDVPDVPELNKWIADFIPGLTYANPLDIRGQAADETYKAVLDRFASTEELDAYVFLGQFAEWDQGARQRVEQCLRSLSGDSPLVVSPLAGNAGWWMEEYRERGLATGNGARETFRALASMAEFMRSSTDSFVASLEDVAAIDPPEAPLAGSEPPMLGFAATMELLKSAGIPVAPYEIVAPDAPIAEPVFEAPWVVKLADVAHRTEHGAVHLDASASDLVQVVEELRALGRDAGLPETVAIQAQARGIGEAFIGLNTAAELGPVVAFGLGGIFVEVARRVGGRIAPFGEVVARALVEELNDGGLLDGVRGGAAWPRDDLARVLVAAGNLAAGCHGWLDTLDINPLIVTADGVVAVDGLAICRESRDS